MKQKLHSTLKRAMFFKALVVMLFAFAATGYAQTSGTWGGIDWTLDTEGTLTIAPTTGTPTKDNSGKWSYEVGQWPEAVKYNSSGGAADIGLWPYKSVQNEIKRLVIKEGVTSIGSFAIASTYCSFPNLGGEVVIPWTVTYIGQEAFMGTNFSKITFQKVPEGETGKQICIAQGAFKKTIVKEFSFPNDRSVELHAWSLLQNKELRHLEIPANLSMLGTNHVDYNHNPGAQTGGSSGSRDIVTFEHSKPVNINDNLKSITFGSEEVRTAFLNAHPNVKKRLTTFIGLTACKTTDGVVEEFAIKDAGCTEFENNNDALDIAKLIYQRTLFSAGTWNALYLPFELPVSALGSNYDVAYYNNMHARDRDNNGSIESMEMEVVLIKNGTLHAHHPYFIRAKNKAAENMNLELSNAKLLRTVPKITYEEVEVEDSTPEGDGESTEGEGGTTEGEGESTEDKGSTTITVEKVEPVNHTVITTSSAYLDFTLTGTYNTEEDAKVFTEAGGNRYAIVSDGSWEMISSAPSPFRVYLTMNEREDSHLKIEAQALAKMRIRVAGEETTEIDEVEMPISAQPTVVYDLQGRRVLNTEGLKGIYIVNGKKVAF